MWKNSLNSKNKFFQNTFPEEYFGRNVKSFAGQAVAISL